MRAVASVLIMLHLAAVFCGPWSQPPPSSELSRRVAKLFRPYLKFASIDNGYRFFAPDPGPSHLIRYEITVSDGSVVQGQFPKRGEHFPRLFYHRHFMLSEMVFSLTAPTMDAPPPHLLAEDERIEIEQQRALARELQQSIANYLLRLHDGDRVRLYVVVHGMPTPTDVLQGMTLSDRSLFQELYLGEFRGTSP